MAETIRIVTFAFALFISIALMVFPFVLHDIAGSRLHTGLPVMMLGVAGMLIYGIGYIPHSKTLRLLFSPYCSGALIISGVLVLAT